MTGRRVIETPGGWMVRCPAHQWHEFPRGRGWSFDGDLVSPTFTPSLNEACNLPGMEGHNPDVPGFRCHFIVTAGVISFCGDCTALAGQSMPLEPWPEARVKYYEALMTERRESIP
jgi:hypothetical protein